MQTIAIFGLGYVGLPLAVAFGKLMPTRPHSAYVDQLKHGRRFVDVRAKFDCAKPKAAGLAVWR